MLLFGLIVFFLFNTEPLTVDRKISSELSESSLQLRIVLPAQDEALDHCRLLTT